MTTSAIFPGTAGISQAALATLFGEMPNFPELVLSGAHNASTTSIVVTTAIPAAWPQVAWITIDTEILRVTSWTGSTFTVAARDGSAGNSQTTTAASHSDGAKVGMYLTALQWNQVAADLISMQTEMFRTSQPNLVLNSDYGRRTVFGLAMPEAFADTSGYTVISGAAPTVASNVVTSTAANELAWQAGTFVWRDGRASGTFKAVATAGIYQIKFRQDANVWLSAKQNNGNFTITSGAGAADTVRATVANALTLNRYYWIDIDVQGTTITGKIYDTGGTVEGVTKASSTLLQTLTFTGVTALTGAAVSVNSDQATAKWGGIATGNGGVYVETWLPESWAITFGGTLGGQAVGYDESTDAGPVSKQFPLRAYIPQAARTITIQQYGAGGGSTTTVSNLSASTVYNASIYVKTSGYGGSDSLWTADFYDRDMSAANPNFLGQFTATGAESSWTRKTNKATSASTGRISHVLIRLNAALTATGTAFFQLPQLERGGVATAWRNAPADDAPIVWRLVGSRTVTFTSATLAAIESRDLGINAHLPWDATIVVNFTTEYSFSATGQRGGLDIQLDGTSFTSAEGVITQSIHAPGATGIDASIAATVTQRAAAGKHRVDAKASIAGGATLTIGTGSYQKMTVTAIRGK